MVDGIEDDEVINEISIKNMFISGYDSFLEVSGAKPGEKTMVDSMYPAIEVIKNHKGDLKTILQKASIKAKEGAESTANMIAKFGRAKNFKEKSLGHRDPGAVSFSIFLEGMARGLK